MILEISCYFISSRWQLATTLNFKSIKILYAEEVWRIKAHHYAIFSQNWSIHSRDIAIFRFSKWPPLPSWIFEITKFCWLTGSRGLTRIILLNIVKLILSILEISQVFEFSSWPLQPSLIFKIRKFYWLTRSKGLRPMSMTNFIKIVHSVVEILRFFEFSRIAIFQLFRMATATILDFWNHEILLAILLQRAGMHQHANFCQNRSIGCIRHLGFVWGIFGPPAMSNWESLSLYKI